jgi:hypothetical protein
MRDTATAPKKMAKTFIGTSIVAAVLVCGCASNPTRSTGVVALQIPEPPPKPDILPVPAPEAPPERPAAAPIEPPATVPAARPTPPVQTNAGAQSAPQTPTAPVPAPEAAPPTPAPELRPAGTAAKSLTGAQVRESLDRTKQKLDAIDRRRLNAGQRADYDSARRFLAQADTAVKANNLLLAQSSVEKAEALANGLR